MPEKTNTRWETRGNPGWGWALMAPDGAFLGSVLARGRFRVTYRAATTAGKIGRPGQDFDTLEEAQRALEAALDTQLNEERD